MRYLRYLLKDEKGVTMIEYALIAALMAVAIIAALTAFGDTLSSVFDNIGKCLSDPSNCPLVGGGNQGG
jgi:pilus assembly protein Flp/PilA